MRQTNHHSLVRPSVHPSIHPPNYASGPWLGSQVSISLWETRDPFQWYQTYTSHTASSFLTGNDVPLERNQQMVLINWHSFILLILLFSIAIKVWQSLGKQNIGEKGNFISKHLLRLNSKPWTKWAPCPELTFFFFFFPSLTWSRRKISLQSDMVPQSKSSEWASA